MQNEAIYEMKSFTKCFILLLTSLASAAALNTNMQFEIKKIVTASQNGFALRVTTTVSVLSIETSDTMGEISI